MKTGYEGQTQGGSDGEGVREQHRECDGEGMREQHRECDGESVREQHREGV